VIIIYIGQNKREGERERESLYRIVRVYIRSFEFIYDRSSLRDYLYIVLRF
jgi:hypothetical protein